MNKTDNKIIGYWFCQLIGWSLFVLIYIFFYITLSEGSSMYLLLKILTIEALTGLMVTHLLRFVIKYFNIVDRSLNEQLIFILLSSIVFSIIYAVCGATLEHYLVEEISSEPGYSLSVKIFKILFSCFTLVLIWVLLYFGFHYIRRTRQEQLDRIRLETVVKELEIKTIKAHINPHFIFNALNSIRALIDENPNRARTAITELSTILRSSMQAEKLELVPLENELKIVRDYLNLEYMRFEDRLNIEYNIDEKTLSLPTPPMMLQTLVENAIKHGISKNVGPGVVRVSTKLEDDAYTIIIENTGAFKTDYNETGFGLASTRNRLYYLYGEKASFQIYQKNEEMVEAKVYIPLNK